MIETSDWTEYVDNVFFVRKLFNKIPSLDRIEIYEIMLSPAGPEVQIRFDLFELPEKIPLRWGRVNRIQIGLVFTEIEQICLKRFDRMNVCSMRLIKSNNSKLNVELDGDTRLSMQCLHARILKVEGYWSEQI